MIRRQTRHGGVDSLQLRAVLVLGTTHGLVVQARYGIVHPLLDLATGAGVVGGVATRKTSKEVGRGHIGSEARDSVPDAVKGAADDQRETLPPVLLHLPEHDGEDAVELLIGHLLPDRRLRDGNLDRVQRVADLALRVQA